MPLGKGCFTGERAEPHIKMSPIGGDGAYRSEAVEHQAISIYRRQRVYCTVFFQHLLKAYVTMKPIGGRSQMVWRMLI